jgi:hypothetical protein
MKVTDYMCVSDTDSAELTVKVAKLLGEGYEPLGGVSMTSCVVYPPMPNIFIAYAQAMVKYEHQPARFVSQPDTYVDKMG